MSTDTTAHVEHIDAGHDAAHDDHSDHKPDAYYVKVALILAAVTAIEVWLSYADVGPLFLPLLLAAMAAKFLAVASIFMHLKFDNRIFSWLFYTGLFLAVGVYIAALTAFQFFG